MQNQGNKEENKEITLISHAEQEKKKKETLHVITS